MGVKKVQPEKKNKLYRSKFALRHVLKVNFNPKGLDKQKDRFKKKRFDQLSGEVIELDSSVQIKELFSEQATVAVNSVKVVQSKDINGKIVNETELSNVEEGDSSLLPTLEDDPISRKSRFEKFTSLTDDEKCNSVAKGAVQELLGPNETVEAEILCTSIEGIPGRDKDTTIIGASRVALVKGAYGAMRLCFIVTEGSRIFVVNETYVESISASVFKCLGWAYHFRKVESSTSHLNYIREENAGAQFFVLPVAPAVIDVQCYKRASRTSVANSEDKDSSASGGICNLFLDCFDAEKNGCLSSCYEFVLKLKERLWHLFKMCVCCSLVDNGVLQEIKYKAKSSFELGAIRNSGASKCEKIRKRDIEQDFDATESLLGIETRPQKSDKIRDVERADMETATSDIADNDKILNFEIEVSKSHEVVLVLFYISLLDDKLHTCRMTLHVPENDTDLSETFHVASRMTSLLTQICHKSYTRPDMNDARSVATGVTLSRPYGKYENSYTLGMYDSANGIHSAYAYGQQNIERRERELDKHLFDRALQFLSDFKDFQLNSGAKAKIKKTFTTLFSWAIILGLIGGFIYLIIWLIMLIIDSSDNSGSSSPCSARSGICEELKYNCSYCFEQYPYLAPTAAPTAAPTSFPTSNNFYGG